MIKSTISQRLDELHEQAAAKYAVWKRARRRLIVERAIWVSAILITVAHASLRIEEGAAWWWTFASVIVAALFIMRAQHVTGQIRAANEFIAVACTLADSIETAKVVFGDGEEPDDDDSYPVPRHDH